MLHEILNYVEKIQKVLDTIHFGVLVEIAVNLIILALIFKAIDVFDNKLKTKFNNNKSFQLANFVPLLTRLIKFIVFFILVAAILQNHGYSVSSLIAGFGITGLAVGFAANATISNVFGTISILTDKSYQVGDYIKVGSIEGTVEDINLRSTKIRSLDNALTIVPNATIANGDIVNSSRIYKRRFFETFGITYDTPDEKIKRAAQIIEEILSANVKVYDDFIVYLDKLADSSINIAANAYFKTSDLNEFRKIKENIILEIVKKYREEGIEFAFPSQSIYMVENEN